MVAEMELQVCSRKVLARGLSLSVKNLFPPRCFLTLLNPWCIQIYALGGTGIKERGAEIHGILTCTPGKPRAELTAGILGVPIPASSRARRLL